MDIHGGARRTSGARAAPELSASCAQTAGERLGVQIEVGMADIVVGERFDLATERSSSAASA